MSVTNFTHFIPVLKTPDQNRRKPRGLGFTIPSASRWRLIQNTTDANVGFMQWCTGKTLATSSRRITAQTKTFPNYTLSEYTKGIVKEINSEFNIDSWKINNNFRSDGLLIEWNKITDSKITFLFTLILGKSPDFFTLEYESRNPFTDLIKRKYCRMLQEAHITYRHSKQT